MKLNGPLADQGLQAFKYHGPLKSSQAMLQRVWIVGIDQNQARVWRMSKDRTLQDIGHFSRAEQSVGEERESARKDFYATLGAWLDTAFHEEAFERLIFIGRIDILQDLNAHLKTDVLTSVIAEIPTSMFDLDEANAHHTIKALINI